MTTLGSFGGHDWKTESENQESIYNDWPWVLQHIVVTEFKKAKWTVFVYPLKLTVK